VNAPKCKAHVLDGEETVECHRARIMGRPGARSVAQLLRVCAAP